MKKTQKNSKKSKNSNNRRDVMRNSVKKKK